MWPPHQRQQATVSSDNNHQHSYNKPQHQECNLNIQYIPLLRNKTTSQCMNISFSQHRYISLSLHISHSQYRHISLCMHISSIMCLHISLCLRQCLHNSILCLCTSARTGVYIAASVHTAVCTTKVVRRLNSKTPWQDQVYGRFKRQSSAEIQPHTSVGNASSRVRWHQCQWL